MKYTLAVSTTEQNGCNNGGSGMSLRDYFAAKAMHALLSSPNCPMDWTEERLAKQSYITADVMLKIRSM